MAKSKLISQVSRLKEASKPGKAWHHAMQRDEPERYQDLIEVVDDFSAGGVVSQKFSSACELRRWLIGADPERAPIKSPFKLPSEESFRRFVRNRRLNRGQKESD